MRTWTMLAVGLLSVVMLGGCASAPRNYSTVELRGLVSKDASTAELPIFLSHSHLSPPETVTITDPYLIKALAKFFPGLGSGRFSFFGINSPPVLELTFSDGVHEPVCVYVRRQYCYWGSNVDKGDSLVNGDLLVYLRALFSQVQVMRKETSP